MNNEVCKLCYQHHEWKWTKMDNFIWKRGTIGCPVRQKDGTLRKVAIHTNSWRNPPKWCDFQLEQVVLLNQSASLEDT